MTYSNEEKEVHMQLWKESGVSKADYAPQGPSRFADSIVFEFQTDVIPYMKEYLEGADYFGYLSDPKDVRLDLIAYVLGYLHTYSDPVYADTVEPYTFDRDTVQWFVGEYKSKLDEYIREKLLIDLVVLRGEGHILDVAGYKTNWVQGAWVGGNEIETYGHPDFLVNRQLYINAIKSYYEQRLGIDNLEFDLPERYFNQNDRLIVLKKP